MLIGVYFSTRQAPGAGDACLWRALGVTRAAGTKTGFVMLSNGIQFPFLFLSYPEWTPQSVHTPDSNKDIEMEKRLMKRIASRAQCFIAVEISSCKSRIPYRGGSRNSLRRGGGFWARILRRGGGGGVRVQVRGNFHIVTSQKKTSEGGGFKPPNPPPIWIRYCHMIYKCLNCLYLS